MSHEIPKAELEKKHERQAVELFNLSTEEKEELKHRIEEHNGLVRIFVHPLGKTENKDRVRNIFTSVIYSKNSPPVIILENAKYTDTFITIANKKSSVLPNNLYIVPTIFDYPYPLVPNKPEPLERDTEGHLKDEDYDYVEEGFVHFVEYLVSVGVKTALVGGTKLEVSAESGNLIRCVGNFIHCMKDNGEINVKLSSATAPLNRSDIRESHPDLL